MQLASMNALETKLEQTAKGAYEELGDIADYVWKSPRLIAAEKKKEIEKLAAYFPFSGDEEKDEVALRLRKNEMAIRIAKVGSNLSCNDGKRKFFRECLDL